MYSRDLPSKDKKSRGRIQYSPIVRFHLTLKQAVARLKALTNSFLDSIVLSSVYLIAQSKTSQSKSKSFSPRFSLNPKNIEFVFINSGVPLKEFGTSTETPRMCASAVAIAILFSSVIPRLKVPNTVKGQISFSGTFTSSSLSYRYDNGSLDFLSFFKLIIRSNSSCLLVRYLCNAFAIAS